MRDNEFILTVRRGFDRVGWCSDSISLSCSIISFPHSLQGYRPELLSYRRCAESLFYLHNESGNIWTHLLGGIFFIIFAAYAGSYVVQENQPVEVRRIARKTARKTVRKTARVF